MRTNSDLPDQMEQLKHTHLQEVLALERRVEDFRKWMNCGGCPTDKTCSVDGHRIFGAFVTDASGVATCELHYHREIIDKQNIALRSIEAMLGTLDHTPAVDDSELISRTTVGVASIIAQVKSSAVEPTAEGRSAAPPEAKI